MGKAHVENNKGFDSQSLIDLTAMAKEVTASSCPLFSCRKD